MLLTMFLVHTPEAETIHSLTKGVVVVEELDRTHDIENDLRILTHEQRVNRSGNFDNVVTWLATPLIPTSSNQHGWA
jgi:hypothetical protein